MLTNRLHRAIIDATKTQAKALHEKLNHLLRQIDQGFDDMIKSKEVPQSEVPVRAAVEEFLDKANPKFEAVKTELKELIVTPTGTPPSPRVVTTATPVAKQPRTSRSSRDPKDDERASALESVATAEFIRSAFAQVIART